MVYLYIILSAACSVLIAHLLKKVEHTSMRTLPTLTINYGFAGLFALILGLQNAASHSLLGHYGFVLICLIAGALFISNFLIYSKSVHLNGMGVTITAMRVSLIIPIVVSLFLYHETAGWSTAAGIALVMGALVLLLPKAKKVHFKNIDAKWLLVAIFMAAGLSDASLKIYQEQLSRAFNPLLFMSFVFGAAFVIGLIALTLRKQFFFTKREVGYGCIIGIPNLYSSVFLIYALQLIEGATAYSLVNALNVAAGTAVGIMYWNDEVSQRQWVGLIVAIVAIYFLLF